MNPTSRATATTSPEPAARPAARWRLSSLLAAALLAGLAVPLAAPGLALVPGAGEQAPGWVVGIFGDGLGVDPELYLLLLYAAIGAWAALLWTIRDGAPRAIWVLVGAALALFALAPPLLSLDVFSYISYARLGIEGLDPYEAAPVDLSGDAAAARVDDFRFASSIYGPLFTLGSYPIGLLGDGAALWSLKLIAALSIAAIAALTARIAALRGIAPAPAAAFVALNPLVLVHLVGGAHNDGLMVALALLGVLLLLTARPLAGAGALVAATAVKAASALYLPFALIGSPQWRALLAGLAGFGALGLAVSLAVFGPDFLDAAGVAGQNQETVSRWSVPATLSRLLGLDVDAVRIVAVIAFALVAVGLLAWTYRGADWIRAAGWTTFALLAATAWMVPWYLIWLLPFAALSRDRALIAAAVALTVFQAVNSIPL